MLIDSPIHSVEVFVSEETKIQVTQFGLKIGNLNFLCLEVPGVTDVKQQINFFIRCLDALRSFKIEQKQQEEAYDRLHSLIDSREEDFNNSELVRDYAEEQYNRDPKNFGW